MQICKKKRNSFCLDGDEFIPHGISRFVMHDQRATSNKLSYDKFLKKMFESGMNTLRLVVPGEFERGVEPEIGMYNAQFLEPLDDVFLVAEEYGIQIILVLLDSASFYASWSPDEFWKYGVYSESFSGPKEVFSNLELRKHLKSRISFLIDHFSKYSNVFAWEVMNEMNKIGELFGEDNCKDITMSWFKDIASHIRSIDNTRLITTSLYGDEVWEEFNKSNYNDFIQIHTYDGEESLDENLKLIEKYARECKVYDKPVLITEFATKIDNPDRKKFVKESILKGQDVGVSALLYASVWDIDADYGMGHGDMDDDLFAVFKKTCPYF